MDQHTLTTVLTGLGVLVAMASYHRAEKKDHATQLESLEHRLDQKNDRRIDGLAARIDTRIDGLETRIDGLDNRFGSLEERMDKGFTEMRTEHRSDMRDVRSYLHSLEQRFYEFLLPRRPAPTGTDDG